MRAAAAVPASILRTATAAVRAPTVVAGRLSVAVALSAGSSLWPWIMLRLFSTVDRGFVARLAALAAAFGALGANGGLAFRRIRETPSRSAPGRRS